MIPVLFALSSEMKQATKEISTLLEKTVFIFLGFYDQFLIFFILSSLKTCRKVAKRLQSVLIPFSFFQQW